MQIYRESIELDKPLVDWLTLTSFEPNVYDVQNKMVAILKELGATVKEPTHTLQYVGKTAANELGGLYVGSAEQKGAIHFLIQISGELCNDRDLLLPVAQGIREGWLQCRRIDLQMTVIEPEAWQQWAFFNRMKRSKRTVGWVESTNEDGELLQTVYVGSRSSGKYLRVYEKWIAETRLLRAEYELKGNTAAAFSRMLFDGSSTTARLYKLLIQQTGDKELSTVYLPMLEYVETAVKPKILSNEPKTEKWLRETVLPSFTRYINDHGSNPEVLRLFKESIQLCEEWI